MHALPITSLTTRFTVEDIARQELGLSDSTPLELIPFDKTTGKHVLVFWIDNHCVVSKVCYKCNGETGDFIAEGNTYNLYKVEIIGEFIEKRPKLYLVK